MITTNSKEYSHIDYKNYPKMTNGYLCVPQPDKKYQALPDVYDRLCSIIYFASKIGGESKRFMLSDKAHKEAMFRAALSEFIALHDYIFEKYGQKIWFNPHTNTNPLLHMLKLLRNYNVHVDTSKLNEQPMYVSTLFDPDTTHEISKTFISNLSVNALSRLQGASFYRSQIEKLITVFDEQQHEFGVSQLIMKCTLDNTACLDVLLPSSTTS